MRLYSKFFLVLYVALSLNHQRLSAAAIPDGLCLLSGSGGYGVGFIVGSVLISAAHVLSNLDGVYYCSLNGRLLPAGELNVDEAVLHPYFLMKRSWTDDHQTGVQSEHVSWMVNTVAGRLFDVGFLKLARPRKTDFVLSRDRSFRELRSSIESSAPAAMYSLSNARQFRTTQLRTLRPMSMFYREEEQATFFESDYDLTDPVDFFLSTHLDDVIPGDSGAPVAMRSADGKYNVFGLVSGRAETRLLDLLYPDRPVGQVIGLGSMQALLPLLHQPCPDVLLDTDPD